MKRPGLRHRFQRAVFLEALLVRTSKPVPRDRQLIGLGAPRDLDIDEHQKIGWSLDGAITVLASYHGRCNELPTPGWSGTM